MGTRTVLYGQETHARMHAHVRTSTDARAQAHTHTQRRSSGWIRRQLKGRAYAITLTIAPTRACPSPLTPLARPRLCNRADANGGARLADDLDRSSTPRSRHSSIRCRSASRPWTRAPRG
eukprot:2761010-Pleurochrysis_carterae.AAC.3